MTTRIIVPMNIDDPQSLVIAVAYAERILGAMGDRRIILLTHTKKELQDGFLVDHLGSDAKLLRKGQVVKLRSGAHIRHETLKTLRQPSSPTVVVAFYAEDELLESVDALRQLRGIVVVPDRANMIDAWTARWNPTVHGATTAQAPVPLIGDAVIVGAFEALSARINLSQSDMHAGDKEIATEFLRILRAKGHQADSDMIKSWAIQHGWKPGAAASLAALAKRILSTASSPDLSKIHDPKGRYERWGGVW